MDCRPGIGGLLASVDGENQSLLGLPGQVLLALRLPLLTPRGIGFHRKRDIKQKRAMENFRDEQTSAREPRDREGPAPHLQTT